MVQTNKSIKYYYSKSKEIIKDEGLCSYLRKLYYKSKDSTFSTNDAYWFTRNLMQPIQQITPRKKLQVEFRFDNETLDWLKKHHNQYSWMYLPKEVEIKEKECHFFPTVRENNKIVGYTKVGVNRVYIMDFDQVIPLPENTALIYDTFVLPEYRGRGIAAFLTSQVMIFLKKSNFQSLWCHIPPWNKASINFYTKAGFTKIDHIRFIRLFGWKIFTRNIPKMMANG